MRVLFLTHRLPFPPNRGDRLRSFHILRTLAAHMEVELLSLVHDDDEWNQAEALRAALDVRVTPIRVPYYRNRVAAAVALATSRKTLTHVLLSSPRVIPEVTAITRERPPDVVLAYCSSMAAFARQAPLTRYPLVIDMVDVDSEKWKALANASAAPLRWVYGRESRYLAEFERSAMATASATLVVNEREADAALSLAPGADVRVVSLGVDVEALRPQRPSLDAPRVVFCGVMDYAPNVNGVQWFVRHVWPVVRREMPTAEFTIVGSNPTGQIRQLASPRDGVEVTGRVADVRSFLWNSAVSVAPLHVARGLQNKVLEAIAAGLPTVVTSNVFEGLPEHVQAACSVADSADAFATHTLRLLSLSGRERRSIAARVDCDALSWQRQLAPLLDILESVALKQGGAFNAAARRLPPTGQPMPAGDR